jgi:hypothetical protein
MLCRAAQFVKPEGDCESLASPRKRERESEGGRERASGEVESSVASRRKARPTEEGASNR